MLPDERRMIHCRMAPQDTKLSLSDTDLQLVNDRTFLLAKRRILDKIASGFGDLDLAIRKLLETQSGPLPIGWENRAGKISRGENLKGLPYLVLDQPAVYGQDGIRALRMLFWWGHGFVLSYHVSGKYLNAEHDWEGICNPSTLILTGNDPWSYEMKMFSDEAAINADYGNLDELGKKQGYIKLAMFIRLEETNLLEKKTEDFLNRILKNSR